MTWTVHLLDEPDLVTRDRFEVFARALDTRGGRRDVVVVAAPDDDLRELDAMVDLARARDDRYRARLDALGARRREDVGDLADILHAIRTVGAQDETRDLVLSYAGLWAAQRVTARLLARGHDAVALDARDLLVVQPSPDEGDLRVETDASIKALQTALAGVSSRAVVVAGSLAAAPDGATVTLGHAGDDHSAFTLAALLGAREVVRWTALAALTTAPPAVAGARALHAVSYATAAALGADVHPALRPAAWKPAFETDLTLEVRSLTETASTVVRAVFEAPDERPVAALGVVAPAVLLRVTGRAVGASSRMFRAVFVALDELKVTPLAVSLPTGTHDLFLTLRAGDADAVAAKLSHALLWEGRARVAQSIERLDRCALVRVALHAPRPSILGELLAALARHDLHPLASAQGASHGVGLVLAEDVSHRALEVLHGAFLT